MSRSHPVKSLGELREEHFELRQHTGADSVEQQGWREPGRGVSRQSQRELATPQALSPQRRSPTQESPRSGGYEFAGAWDRRASGGEFAGRWDHRSTAHNVPTPRNPEGSYEFAGEWDRGGRNGGSAREAWAERTPAPPPQGPATSRPLSRSSGQPLLVGSSSARDFGAFAFANAPLVSSRQLAALSGSNRRLGSSRLFASSGDEGLPGAGGAGASSPTAHVDSPPSPLRTSRSGRAEVVGTGGWASDAVSVPEFPPLPHRPRIARGAPVAAAAQATQLHAEALRDRASVALGRSGAFQARLATPMVAREDTGP